MIPTNKERKQKFQIIRMKLMDVLRKKANNTLTTDLFTWDYSSGSTSIDSDLDITLVPKLQPMTDPTFFSNYYQSIIDTYKSYFELPMEVMFDMNIYASPFFYKTPKLKNVNTYLVDRSGTAVNWTSIEKENVVLAYLDLQKEYIREHQYDVAKNKIQIETGKNIGDYLKEYAASVFTNKSTNQSMNTQNAVESLSKSTFLVSDAYHTQGAVLHVNCPQEFRIECYNQMHAEYFVCSMYENLQYAILKISEKNNLKAIKYITRYLEAKVIIIIKLITSINLSRKLVKSPTIGTRPPPINIPNLNIDRARLDSPGSLATPRSMTSSRSRDNSSISVTPSTLGSSPTSPYNSWAVTPTALGSSGKSQKSILYTRPLTRTTSSITEKHSIQLDTDGRVNMSSACNPIYSSKCSEKQYAYCNVYNTTHAEYVKAFDLNKKRASGELDDPNHKDLDDIIKAFTIKSVYNDLCACSTECIDACEFCKDLFKDCSNEFKISEGIPRLRINNLNNY